MKFYCFVKEVGLSISFGCVQTLIWPRIPLIFCIVWLQKLMWAVKWCNTGDGCSTVTFYILKVKLLLKNVYILCIAVIRIYSHHHIKIINQIMMIIIMMMMMMIKWNVLNHYDVGVMDNRPNKSTPTYLLNLARKILASSGNRRCHLLARLAIISTRTMFQNVQEPPTTKTLIAIHSSVLLMIIIISLSIIIIY